MKVRLQYFSIGGDLPDGPQRSSGQRGPTSTRFWQMAFDAVQVQRIAIWNTSGARHLPVAGRVFWFAHPLPLLVIRSPLACKASLFLLYHQIAATQARSSAYVKPFFCKRAVLDNENGRPSCPTGRRCTMMRSTAPAPQVIIRPKRL